MFEIILAIILLIVSLIGPKYIPDKTKKDYETGKKIKVSQAPIRLIVSVIGIVLSIIIGLTGCITTVHTGYTGIVTKFNQVQDYTFEAGLHFKSPFISIIEMDNREQRLQFNMEAFSSDIQEVQITGSINYSIDKATAMRLYKEVGVNYSTILITPRTQEVVKAKFSQYSAEGLIANRQLLSSEILAALRDDLAPHGINVISVSIENIDFTDAFTNAVEAKQVATQDKQRAQTEQERMTMEEEAAAKRAVIIANAEAEKAKIAAQADLEVVKIQAEAALYAGEKEAEMNKRISEALSDGLIKYYWIKQWNGKLPTVTTNSSMTLVDMEDVIGEE